MIQGRCPICSRAFEIQGIDDLPSFPFCSHRCRLVDLGRWIDGEYAIPGIPADAEAEDDDPSGSPETGGRFDDED